MSIKDKNNQGVWIILKKARCTHKGGASESVLGLKRDLVCGKFLTRKHSQVSDDVWFHIWSTSRTERNWERYQRIRAIPLYAEIYSPENWGGGCDTGSPLSWLRPDWENHQVVWIRYSGLGKIERLESKKYLASSRDFDWHHLVVLREEGFVYVPAHVSHDQFVGNLLNRGSRILLNLIPFCRGNIFVNFCASRLKKYCRLQLLSFFNDNPCSRWLHYHAITAMKMHWCFILMEKKHMKMKNQCIFMAVMAW